LTHKVLFLSKQVYSADIPEMLLSVTCLSVLGVKVAFEVDARDLACPMPLLKAKQGLRNLVPGELLRILATDPGSLRDFVSFVQLAGHRLEGFYQEENTYCYLIRK